MGGINELNNLNYLVDYVIENKMGVSDHIEEFSQRLIFCVLTFIIVTLVCFADITQIVKIFQAPVIEVKFLQFGPGEYFFTTLKIALFSGILITSPLILYQIFLYVAPGITKKERNFLFPIIIGSGLLFAIGTCFSYFFLVPATLRFFVVYSSEIVEPLWSFDQYFDFVAVLIFTTGLTFQVPVVQVILGFLGAVSGQDMLCVWKYVVVISTILAAIITPSTDPVTQVLMTCALLVLYIGGLGIVFLFKK
jgi:sec-independent protein translocase protein TatC